MTPIGLFAEATRARFLPASLIPAALGAALAAWHGFPLRPLRIAATLAGAALVHLSINVLNDVGDARSGADAANPTPGRFSGGSRVIQNGLLSTRAMAALACVLLAAGGAVGLWLNATVPGNAVLVIGAVGVAMGVLYTLGPMPLAYTPLGLPVTGLAFGPVICLGAYVALAGRVHMDAVWASTPLMLLLALELCANQVPDRPGDAAAGKRTPVVLLGAGRAHIMYAALAAAAYASVILCVLTGRLPAWSLAVLATTPIAFFAWRTCRRYAGEPARVMPACAATIALHLLGGIILVASVALAATLR